MTEKRTPENGKGGGNKSPKNVQLNPFVGATNGTTATTKLAHAIKLADELNDFVQPKHNVHGEIKKMIAKIQNALVAAGKEQKALEAKAQESEEKAKKWRDLAENTTVRAQPIMDMLQTPVTRPQSKRGRQTPESPGNTASKKPRKTRDPTRKADEWKEVQRKEKKTQRSNQKLQPKTVRPRADALIVGIGENATYADVLRKVKSDPNLKGLGDQVARIRRTKNGEILFELRRDPSAKSSEFKELMEKSLGEAAKVRALAQEVTIECRNLDEVTTDAELRTALKEQFETGEAIQTATIRLRKAYGEMQIATIKLPTEVANKMLETGKVKVGWTVCTLRATQQLERCFKCMGFGHKAMQCKGADRSKLCRRCGEEGHLGRTCTKQPKCMLCPAGEASDHMTGSFRCPAYKEAMAKRGWR